MENVCQSCKYVPAVVVTKYMKIFVVIGLVGLAGLAGLAGLEKHQYSKSVEFIMLCELFHS
eukprot:115330-Karenia_brevis.AAC.2